MRPVRLALLACLGSAILAASSPAFAAVGDDPGVAQQWGLRQIGARSSWDRGVVGSGATVAVIDTGIDAGHEDLKGQIAASVTCVNTDGDVRRCTAGASDIQGHGTHVSGIAAAASNNVGVAGVAPGSKVVSVRVFQSTQSAVRGPGFGAYSEDISAGIRWVIANVKTKGSINLSLGGEFPVLATVDGVGFEDAIEEAWRAGWVPVLASGNENVLGVGGSSNYGSLNALVVGATGPDDKLSYYSSPFGNAKWGLVAPGGNAENPDPNDDRSPCALQPERCVLSTYNGGQYALLQGTSMATPHVAGAVALLMGGGLSNADAVQRLLSTANKTVSCGQGCKGRLDVAKATAGLGAPQATAPSGTAAAPAGGPPPSNPSAPSGSPPPSTASRTTATTARRSVAPPVATPTATPPPEPAGDPSAVAAEPVPVTDIPPAADEPPNNDALTDLTIESAAAAVESSQEVPARLPWPAVALAAFALVGVAGWSSILWRGRRLEAKRT